MGRDGVGHAADQAAALPGTATGSEDDEALVVIVGGIPIAFQVGVPSTAMPCAPGSGHLSESSASEPLMADRV